MAVRCTVFIAVSVDGFIATPDGGVEWLSRPEYTTDSQSDHGYQALIDSIDAIVMGRLSYEKVQTFGEWPYEGTTVVVLTSGELEVPEELAGSVMRESGAPEEVVARLEARGMRHLYIDGGVTIQRFLRAGLIDDMVLTRIPVLLGDGIPLFGSIGVERPLEHIDTTTYESGFVQSTYRVRPPRSAEG